MNRTSDNGIYFIDKDFRILHYNNTVKAMSPAISAGEYCYNVFACRTSPCPNCPVYDSGRQANLYNRLTHEWVYAQAAEVDLPQLGKCHAVTFYKEPDLGSDIPVEEAPTVRSDIEELMGDNDRTGMIGGYCEDGFPLFFANEKMVEMLGYDDYEDFRRGIKGMVANTIHPDDMAQVVEDLGTEYYVGLEYETVYRMPRKDGTWFWTIDKGRVVEAEDGRLAIVSFCTDITDAIRDQERLAEQNHLLQQQNRLMGFINSGMPGGYHRCSGEEGFPFVYISKKFLDMLGFTRDEIVERFGNKYINLVHPDDRMLLLRSVESIPEDSPERDISLKYRMITKSGEYLRVRDNSRASEYGGKSFFQGVIIDVSAEEDMKEHIEAMEIVQSALQDALTRETQYRQQLNTMQNEILDAISCGVYAYEQKSHRLLVVNNAAKKMIGCPEDGDPMAELKAFLLERVLPEDRQRVADARGPLERDGYLTQDYRALVNGEIVNIHSSIKLLENAVGEKYILVTMLDTTEQAKLTNYLVRERTAYRDALANGSEFFFLFDVTDGMIREEFITAHGVNLVRAMGMEVPVSYDDLLAAYVEKCHIEFADEKMARNFKSQYLLDSFRKGVTNVISEYYIPERDMSIRTSCLLSLDDETGHVQAAIVGDNISDARRKEKEQREALKKANDEVNLRMNAITDGISGGLKIVDIDNGYKYEYISEGAAMLQGYEVDEFLEKFGSRVTNNIYPGEGEPALAEANRQMDEKGSYAVKYRVEHKDGSIRWVIDRGKFVEDKNTGKRYWYILMQDITDLEERNEQLNDVLMMQKQMADSLGSGIFAYRLPDREVLVLNQEARKMFSLIGSDEKHFGMDIINKITPEDMPVMREAVTKLKEPGDHVEYIFHSQIPDGERISIKCHTKLLSFNNGSHYILSAITDITEQELTEKRLDAERKQYRNALAYSSDSIFNIDLTDGFLRERVVDKNGRDLLASLGLTIPLSFDDMASAWFNKARIISNSADLEIIKDRKKLIEAFNSGTTIIDVEYHIPADGRYYYVLCLLYKINDHIMSSFILHDITAERHEEKQKRSIIESLGKIYLALYLFSFTENRCTVLKASDDIASQLHDECTIQEFYAIYLENFVEPEYRDDIREFLSVENIRAALADTDHVSIEFKRKILGWCRITLVAADRAEDGTVNSVVFAGNVIEKQKQAELAQQEALKMAYDSANVANSAKTDFLANMSHDIRTPMNAIIGMTAIAGTHLDDKKRVADCLSKINISSKHLLGIINEVLDMSKIESGKMELNEEGFNLPELIDNLLTMSKPEVEAKGHSLTVSIRNIEHEHVIGDSQRIQQVFMNLMSNAIKYTPAGGRIGLTISEKSTNKQQIGCYEFIFEDNGIGMSEDYIEHIFEPFTRDSRAEKIQGTGLGMAITRNIIQMMNGTIDIKSRVDEGTSITVTIFLKLRNEDESVPCERFIDLPILVADDDADSCEYTCELLKEIGMKGEWVLSGQEAVDKAEAHYKAGKDYYAIILDWKMPGMDGVATTKELRRVLGDSIPIVIISAYDWSDIELEARAAGANAFISKPLFKSRMVHLFNELLGTEKSDRVSTELDALSEEDFSGKRALLVEDNALNAEIAGEILEMAGLTVEFAVNGKEAVDIMTTCEEGYFDVVFMDIQMPVMNGYEAARAIRALPRNYTKSVPILAMTANAFAEDVAAAKNAGMNEHIAKPLDFNQLTKALKKWLT